MSLAPIHRYIGRIIHLMRKEKGMRQSELALLTGLKQPNLSRIENGLVSPRQVTLEKIAKALGVEVQVFYSESKVQEVERKWAASLGPKHAALMLAGKLTPVPLLETPAEYPVALTDSGEPQGQLEVMMQFPPFTNEPEGSQRFALRVLGDSMQSSGNDGFKPGEIVIFSSGPEVKSGDYAFVMLKDSAVFRQVEFAESDNLRLKALSPNNQERNVARGDVKKMWKLVRHVRSFN
jgi:transcriptional regulator with XRE-family HTH domain